VPRKNNEPARIPDCHPDRKHCARGMCKQCYDRDYGNRNREKLNARARKWAKDNPKKVERTRKKYNYGISLEEIQARINAQDGLCKICMKRPAKEVDHNHETGQVRSILCGKCNRAIGLFDEDQMTLLSAVRYLRLWENTGKRVDGKE